MPTVATRIIAVVLLVIAVACIATAVDLWQNRNHLSALAIGTALVGVGFGAGGLVLWGSMKKG